MTTVAFIAGCKPENDLDKEDVKGGDVLDCVDLGLPSGILWATCNMGAATPEGFGDYFAWGETKTKTTYCWSTYKYCNKGEGWNTLTKYCNDTYYGYNGFADNLITLQPSDDAAIVNGGIGWRMPVGLEWEELYQNTTHTWTTQNGVNGRLFTASNGNSLFLPAAGCRLGDEFNFVGLIGGYWSSSLDTVHPSSAWYFSFGSGDYGMGGGGRSFGLSVRPVLQCTVPQEKLCDFH